MDKTQERLGNIAYEMLLDIRLIRKTINILPTNINEGDITLNLHAIDDYMGDLHQKLQETERNLDDITYYLLNNKRLKEKDGQAENEDKFLKLDVVTFD